MTVAKVIGTVYAWQDADGWKYARTQAAAQGTAETAKLLDDIGERVLWIQRGKEGFYIWDAVGMDAHDNLPR
jgi:hypothetical protein